MRGCSNLEDYLVEKLERKSKAEFQAHIGQCSKCREEVSDWSVLKEQISDWASVRKLPEPSPGEAASLVVSLRPRTARPLWRQPVFYGGLAAACLATFVVVFLMNTPVHENGAGTSREDNRVTRIVQEPELPETPVEQSPIRVLYSLEGELPSSKGTSARQLSVPGEGRLLLGVGSDHVAVGAHSKIEVLKAEADETRIKLLDGSVAAEVEPRDGRGSFAVEARSFIAKVVGTRFMVSMLPDSRIQVAVDKGRVEVVEPDETVHAVSEGQVLEFGKKSPWSYSPLAAENRLELNGLLSATEMDEQAIAAEEGTESEEPSDRSEQNSKRSARKREENRGSQSFEEFAPARQAMDMNAVRTLILEGRYAQAEAALGIHLKAAPDDVAGWSLLATCLRKSGKWRGAVTAYRQVIEKGKPQVANAARFDAAVLLQDKLGKHSAAGSLLKEYLEGPLLLEAEALLRLARARMQSGRKDEARRLLRQIVEHHRSTSAAIRAARLLNEMAE